MINTYRTTRPNLKTIVKALLLLTFLLTFATSTQAVLNVVGPIDNPSPPNSGFPLWYQDANGLQLDACVPTNAAQVAAGVCLILPPDVAPFQFPTNYPLEIFYWFARARVDLFGAPPGQAHRAAVILALEGSFANGVVQAPDQITFGRTRIFIDAPAPGTYTVTYPYGVKTFTARAAGTKAISFTEDIGIAPGVFTGALQSGIGPFLRRALVPGGPAEPFVPCPGDTSGDLFLSDGVAPVKITGSPFDTNYFKVCVTPNIPVSATNPGGGLDGAGNNCVIMEDFDLVGKLSTAPATPANRVTVNSATYTRSAAGAQVDVTATATTALGAPAPVLSMGDPGGTIPSALMNGNAQGLFFGQSIPPNPAAIPATVVVTNTTAVPVVSATKAVVDNVTVSQASFDPATVTLNITATSSDKVAPPTLVAVNLPGSVTGADPLVPTPTATDPAEQTLTFTVPGGAPPASVTVTSNKGGLGTAPVTAVVGGVFPTGAPVTVKDIFTLKIGAATPPLSIPMVMPIFANDTGFVRGTIVFTVKPKKGTVAYDPATGRVTYTYTGAKRNDQDTFRYTLSNATGLRSNVSTVVIKIVL